MTQAGSGPSGSTEEISLVTTCGRRIAVRRLRFGSADRPVSRLALDVGEDRVGDPGVWAALTPDEARSLAGLLVQQSATTPPVDGESGRSTFPKA
ncbi:hypothetical protein AB0N92_35285 [Streptomyces sp. NPDC093248]|uniref:hypothetical protein n=1 Tax=Streptomyces sp. NPDC093248 TaxID=3155072 RepID=UPI00344A2F51